MKHDFFGVTSGDTFGKTRANGFLERPGARHEPAGTALTSAHAHGRLSCRSCSGKPEFAMQASVEHVDLSKGDKNMPSCPP